jgi:hypothetical protein
MNDALQTLVIQLVGGCARRAAAKGRTNGYTFILLCNVLMNDIIREPRERGVAAVKKHFDFVGGGMFADSLEDVGGLFLAQH